MVRKAVGTPSLIFSMPVDNPGGQVIAGYNRGRLALVDDLGLIGRWVFSSSYDGKQKVNDWNTTGGIIPPTSEMPGNLWYEISTKLIKQPGQPVPEGFIIYYKGSNTFVTTKGARRSEIMLHPDSNYKSAPGSYGCLVALPNEYEGFRDAFIEACKHLEHVRMIVLYTY